ncbi:MAG: hypothetical protein R3Y43_04380 [Alphaproteobacteria bacterium]
MDTIIYFGEHSATLWEILFFIVMISLVFKIAFFLGKKADEDRAEMVEEEHKFLKTKTIEESAKMAEEFLKNSTHSFNKEILQEVIYIMRLLKKQGHVNVMYENIKIASDGENICFTDKDYDNENDSYQEVEGKLYDTHYENIISIYHVLSTTTVVEDDE